MPEQRPTPEQLWEKKITFFSIDTSIIQSAGYNFSQGALNQLPHQLPASMGLQLTEVVLEEIKNHRMQPVLKAVEQLQNASKEIARLTDIGMGDVNRLFSALKIPTDAERMFEQEVVDYTERCRGGILPISDVDAGALFKDYFAARPPFEEGKNKKFEFPDAASLQLLQTHAENNDTLGIIVSADGGWKDFARTSDRLYHVSSIDELTALFAATDAHAEAIKENLGVQIKDSQSQLHQQIQRAIGTHVGNSDWDASDVFASSGHRLEPEVYDTEVISCDLSGAFEIWPSDEDRRSWIIELTGYVTVKASVSAEFFVWDSIDREELSLGSSEAELEEQIEVEVYLTCSNVGLDTSPEMWKVEIDIAPGSYAIAPFEMELDYGDHEI